MKKPTTILIFGACIAAVLLRIVPLPKEYNFSALGALALLSGALIRRPLPALAVPLICRAFTDIWLELKTGSGFYDSMAFDYAAYAVICLLGRWIHARYWLAMAAGGVGAGTIFFLVSNFGVWLMSSDHHYPADVRGLLECYRLGIPFARGTFAGDVTFSLAFFGLAQLLVERHRESVADRSNTQACPVQLERP